MLVCRNEVNPKVLGLWFFETFAPAIEVPDDLPMELASDGWRISPQYLVSRGMKWAGSDIGLPYWETTRGARDYSFYSATLDRLLYCPETKSRELATIASSRPELSLEFVRGGIEAIADALAHGDKENATKLATPLLIEIFDEKIRFVPHPNDHNPMDCLGSGASLDEINNFRDRLLYMQALSHFLHFGVGADRSLPAPRYQIM